MYYYDEEQKTAFAKAQSILQKDFEQPIITKALPFISFKASRESIQNYYKKHPEAPFCKRYITPKLNVLKEKLPSMLSD
jgi:peptide-methionine (S)-S-oxide reductase